MSDLQHKFADAESASFLPKEENEIESEHVHHLHSQEWRPWRLLAHIFSYTVLFLISFGLGRHSSAPELKIDTFPRSQSMIGQVLHKTIIFKPDASFDEDPFGPDMVESPWHKLSPPGKGHIRVDDPPAWNISGGYPLNDAARPGAEEYTLSVFHQLHCLAAIKSRMSRLQDWYEGKNDQEYLRFALGEEHVRGYHIYHCFDYIRQAIMCAGDTALERARMVDGKLARGVDGWGVEHQCRDWDIIFNWAKEHRSGDDEGID
ncbi:hypothetical protein B0T14DRAFT_146492 [Immersiella caudata]|uniref:Oxidase ustYa n=1 Tax=Immersiella caudata TaxID=314043 RepID=A0AA39X6Y5_9PEZI|nr:hypothetical protein B0T14DRAFT_146492 [Immersiella caudata]